MAREFFKNLPDKTTPLNAQRMNGFLNGKEAMGSIVVDDISCKNKFNINGNYTSVDGSPTISGSSITFPNSDGNGGHTKFSQLIPIDGTITLSATISNGGGIARFLLFPLDSSKNVITDLEIGSGYTYLSAYGGYWNNSPDGDYSLQLNFPENVKYFQLGFVHVPSTFTNIQIEKGDTATNYSEYKKLDTDIYSFDTNLTYNSASSQSFQSAILKNAKLVVCNFHSTDGNWDIQTQHLTSGTSFTSMQTSTNWYVASNFDSTLGKITFLTKSDNSNFVLNKITVVK